MLLFTAIGLALALFGALTMPLFAAVPAVITGSRRGMA